MRLREETPHFLGHQASLLDEPGHFPGIFDIAKIGPVFLWRICGCHRFVPFLSLPVFSLLYYSIRHKTPGSTPFSLPALPLFAACHAWEHRWRWSDEQLV